MPDRDVYYDDGVVRKTAITDSHIPGVVYRHVETNETPCVEANKAIRSCELLKQDSPSKFVDGDVIAFAFSFPSHADFMILSRDEPDLMDDLINGTNAEVLKAAQTLAILYPQWVTSTKKIQVGGYNGR